MTPDALARFVLYRERFYFIQKITGEKVRLTGKSNTREPLAGSTIR